MSYCYFVIIRHWNLMRKQELEPGQKKESLLVIHWTRPHQIPPPQWEIIRPFIWVSLDRKHDHIWTLKGRQSSLQKKMLEGESCFSLLLIILPAFYVLCMYLVVSSWPRVTSTRHRTFPPKITKCCQPSKLATLYNMVQINKVLNVNEEILLCLFKINTF